MLIVITFLLFHPLLPLELYTICIDPFLSSQVYLKISQSQLCNRILVMMPYIDINILKYHSLAFSYSSPHSSAVKASQSRHCNILMERREILSIFYWFSALHVSLWKQKGRRQPCINHCQPHSLSPGFAHSLRGRRVSGNLEESILEVGWAGCESLPPDCFPIWLLIASVFIYALGIMDHPFMLWLEKIYWLRHLLVFTFFFINSIFNFSWFVFVVFLKKKRKKENTFDNDYNC